jgi:hypothetical protein
MLPLATVLGVSCDNGPDDAADRSLFDFGR